MSVGTNEANEIALLRQRIQLLEEALWYVMVTEWKSSKNLNFPDAQRSLGYLRPSDQGFDQKALTQILELYSKSYGTINSKIDKRLNLNEKRIDHLNKEVHEDRFYKLFGLEELGAPTIFFFPVRVYASFEFIDFIFSEKELVNSIKNILIEFEFEIANDYGPVYGSFFQKWIAKTKDPETREQIVSRLKKMERALELQGLNKPQAEIDEKQASAVAALNASLENISDAAIQIGSLLYLKVTKDGRSMVQVKSLSARQLIALESNSELLESPATVFREISKIASESAESTSSVPDANQEALTERRGAKDVPRKIPLIKGARDSEEESCGEED